MNTIFKVPKFGKSVFINAIASWKILIFLLTCIASGASAQDQAPIGQTIVSIGSVKSINSSQIEKALKRGDTFALLDTILVGPISKTQLKFIDGGIINLIASTEYKVDSYVFNDPNQKSQFLSTLAKGGFRAISGEIAKENINGTAVRTPIATIGLRGTIYEALLANGKLLAGCEEGKLVISNPQGTLEIGPSSNTLYASVKAGEAPMPLKEKPSELAAVSFDMEGGIPIKAPAAPEPTLQKLEQREPAFSQPPMGYPTNRGITPTEETYREAFIDQQATADFSQIDLEDAPYGEYDEGCAYDSSRRAIQLAPTIAIGALVAVFVVVTQFSEHHHHHHSKSASCYSSRSSCPPCCCCH